MNQRESFPRCESRMTRAVAAFVSFANAHATGDALKERAALKELRDLGLRVRFAEPKKGGARG